MEISKEHDLVLIRHSKFLSSANIMLARKFSTDSGESSLTWMHKFLLLDKYYRPIISTLIILIFGPILLLQTCYFLTNLKSVPILKYFACYTGYFYVLTTNILYPIVVRFYIPRIKAFSMKRRKCVTKLKTTYLGFMQTLLISAAFVTTVTTIYTWSQLEDELNLTWVVLNYYVSLDHDIYVAVNWIIFLLAFTLSYSSSAMPLYFIYSISHMDLQLLVLTDHVNGLKKRDINKFGLTVKNLEAIVRMHLQITQYNQSILKSNEIVNMIYVVNGIMINCCSLFTLQQGGFDTINGIVLLIAFFLYSGCINYVAQNYINDSINFINALYGLRWYEWDRECQKFYLIMVINISKEFNVPVGLLGNVGNDLLKKILRFSYTMKCVIFPATNGSFA